MSVTISMSESVERFIGELRMSPQYRDRADRAAAAFLILDVEADGSPDAVALFEAIVRIINEPRPIDERVAEIKRLVAPFAG